MKLTLTVLSQNWLMLVWQNSMGQIGAPMIYLTRCNLVLVLIWESIQRGLCGLELILMELHRQQVWQSLMVQIGLLTILAVLIQLPLGYMGLQSTRVALHMS